MSEAVTAAAALVVAHPGHELRVHHWMERTRPLVCVLTDGSGPAGASRLGSTSEVLRGVAATPGPIYGRFTDRALYEVILGGRADVFLALARELGAVLVEKGVDVVVGDAREGFNPVHDLCRMTIDCALALASRRSIRTIRNLAFGLYDDPSFEPNTQGVVRLRLTDEALERKAAAAAGYADIEHEIALALGAFGREAFRHEPLSPANGSYPKGGTPVPLYESYGETRAAQGIYSRVLRYQEHVAPIERALAAAAAGDPA
jgi:hypothetical protein